MDDVELKAFQAWCAADVRHMGAYARASAINNVLSRTTVQESLRPARENLEVEWSGASWNRAAANPRRAFLRFGAMAASIALVAAASALYMLPDESIVVAKGEFRKVQLADHSVVNINGGSSIDVKLTRSARDITLHQGEAWFEVAKDKSKPFTVAAGQARVRAVGTAFGVRRYSNGAEVMVTEGTVEVLGKEGGQKQLLTAGDLAFIPQQTAKITVIRKPEEIKRKLAWMEGKVIFINQTLTEAVADFNRYSLRRIVIMDPQLGSKTFVGQYPIDAAEQFAKDVSAFLEVPIVITADRILIGAHRAGAAKPIIQ